MNFVVSKRYVDALFKSFNEEELENVLQKLKELSKVVKDENFLNIINSPQVSSNDKVNLFLKFVNKPDKKFTNFLKILIKNKRANLIIDIEKILEQRILKAKNIAYANLYTNYDLQEDEIALLKNKFSKKFNTNIEINIIKSDAKGLRVDFENLGYEINLSTQNIKSKIKNYILKVI